MPTNRPSLPLLAILLSGCILSACETLTLQNRTACFVNGELSLGATCAGTISGQTSQLSTQDTISMLEAGPNHAPAVFQSADDYGEETVELSTACRMLGDDCTDSIKTLISQRNKLMDRLRAVK